MKEARFVFQFENKKNAGIIFKSLIPEIKHKIPKTDIKFHIEDKKFFLSISAKDISSLRAACNSYLRWINIALKVINIS
jgi:tRNA threonylcarbamoyladenosine modification (KEOPS) complex  Pcc1 subunit